MSKDSSKIIASFLPNMEEYFIYSDYEDPNTIFFLNNEEVMNSFLMWFR